MILFRMSPKDKPTYGVRNLPRERMARESTSVPSGEGTHTFFLGRSFHSQNGDSLGQMDTHLPGGAFHRPQTKPTSDGGLPLAMTPASLPRFLMRLKTRLGEAFPQPLMDP